VTLAKPNRTLSPAWGKSVGGVSERPTHVDGGSDPFSATGGRKDGERHPVLRDEATLRGVSSEWRAWPVRHVGRSSSLAYGRTGDIGCPLGRQGGERTVRSRHKARAPDVRGMICLSCSRHDASFTWSRDPFPQIVTQLRWGYPSGVTHSKRHRGRANP